MLHPNLCQYSALINFLNSAFGADYQVFLYDISGSDPVLACSSEQAEFVLPGESIHELIQICRTNQDTAMHHALSRHQTVCAQLIYDGSKPIGLLCIIFDDHRYRAACEQIMRLCYPSMKPPEMFTLSLPVDISEQKIQHHNEAVARDAAVAALQNLGVGASRLTSEERLHIIQALDKDGIFLLKGSVKDVAMVLGCSAASVYRYLSQLRMDSLGF